MLLSRRRVVVAVAAVTAVAILGAQAAEAAQAASERGREVYEKNCLECHGPAGKGDGETAVKRKFHPRDMTHGSYKCRCTPTAEVPADDDLVRSVTQGLPGTPMLPYGGDLSPEDIRAVVAYIKGFSPRFAKDAAPTCLPIPENPAASSPESVIAGQQLYRLLQCWQCHGKSGAGDGPSAATLKDDWGQPVKPRRFSGKFKCGAGDRDLYRTLHTGLAGSPMPSYADALLFAREAGANLSGVEKAYGAAARDEVAAYLAGEPDQAALAALDEAARAKLAAARTWALVHYLRTLAAPGE